MNNQIDISIASNIVKQIYLGVLGREADQSGLDRYSDLITTPDGITTFLRAIISSDEFVNLVRSSKEKIIVTQKDIEQEKIVFLHLPKSGGSTLHELLVKWKSEEEVCPERHNKLHTFFVGELVKYRVFSGHYDYISTQLIPGPKAIITMFRNPIDRLVSLYNFQKAHNDEVIEKEKLYLARLANTHSMVDFFQLDEIRNHPSINNAMTRMLSQRLQSHWEHKIHSASYVDSSDLEKAFKALQEMCAFGFVERYEQSVAWIFKSLGLVVPDVIPRAMEIDTLIKTHPNLKEIDKEQPTEDVLSVMEDLINLDIQLYDRAMELFDNNITEPNYEN
jgi:hypothetical protein